MLLRLQLVDDTEHTQCLPIAGMVGNEVVRPHMVGVLGPQTYMPSPLHLYATPAMQLSHLR